MAPKKKKTAVSKDDAQPVGTNSNGASLWQFGPAERVDVPYVLRPFGLNHVVTKVFEMGEPMIETAKGLACGTETRLDMRAAFLYGAGRYLYAFYNANPVNSFYFVGRLCSVTHTWERLGTRNDGIFLPWGSFVLPYAKRRPSGQLVRAFLLFTPTQGVKIVSLNSNDKVCLPPNDGYAIPYDTMLQEPQPQGPADRDALDLLELGAQAVNNFALFIKWLSGVVDTANDSVYLQAEVSLSQAGLLRNTAIFRLNVLTKRWDKLAIEETESRKMPVGAAMALHDGHLYMVVRKKKVSQGTAFPLYSVKEVVRINLTTLVWSVHTIILDPEQVRSGTAKRLKKLMAVEFRQLGDKVYVIGMSKCSVPVASQDDSNITHKSSAKKKKPSRSRRDNRNDLWTLHLPSLTLRRFEHNDDRSEGLLTKPVFAHCFELEKSRSGPTCADLWAFESAPISMIPGCQTMFRIPLGLSTLSSLARDTFLLHRPPRGLLQLPPLPLSSPALEKGEEGTERRTSARLKSQVTIAKKKDFMPKQIQGVPRQKRNLSFIKEYLQETGLSVTPFRFPEKNGVRLAPAGVSTAPNAPNVLNAPSNGPV